MVECLRVKNLRLNNFRKNKVKFEVLQEFQEVPKNFKEVKARQNP